MTGVFYMPLQWHGGGTDTKSESAHKGNSGEENSPSGPAGIQTQNLLTMSPVFYQQATPVHLSDHTYRAFKVHRWYVWHCTSTHFCHSGTPGERLFYDRPLPKPFPSYFWWHPWRETTTLLRLPLLNHSLQSSSGTPCESDNYSFKTACTKTSPFIPPAAPLVRY